MLEWLVWPEVGEALAIIDKFLGNMGKTCEEVRGSTGRLNNQQNHTHKKFWYQNYQIQYKIVQLFLWWPEFHRETPHKSCLGCTPNSLKSSALTKSSFLFLSALLVYCPITEGKQINLQIYTHSFPRHFYSSEKDRRVISWDSLQSENQPDLQNRKKEIRQEVSIFHIFFSDITEDKKNHPILRGAMKNCRELLEFYSIKPFYTSPFKIAQVIRMAKIIKTNNLKCWRGWETIRSLVHLFMGM